MRDDLAELLDGDVLAIAPQLIGWRLRTSFDGKPTEVTITEIEAYGGEDDAASHAFRGRTPRNASMFGPAGTLYVYRSYGIHWCANVVVGRTGKPAAILIRGGLPATGLEVMEARRDRSDHVADGPGKLCAALGITGEHDGSSLTHGPVRLAAPDRPRRGAIEAGPRVGISRAVDRPWRFVARSSGRSSLAPT